MIYFKQNAFLKNIVGHIKQNAKKMNINLKIKEKYHYR